MKLLKEIGRNARVDWIVILLSSIVVAIVLAIGGFYLYNALMKGDIQGNQAISAVPPSKFSEKTLSSFTNTLDERAAMSITTLAGYRGVGDPSI